MDPKKWYASKTLWVAVLGIVGQLAVLAQGGITWPEFQAAIGTFVMAVLMFVFRLVTKQPVE